MTCTQVLWKISVVPTVHHERHVFQQFGHFMRMQKVALSDVHTVHALVHDVGDSEPQSDESWES